MMIRILTIALIGLGGAPAPADMSELSPTAAEAFQHYVERVEASVVSRVRGQQPFLWADSSPARRQRIRRGEVVVERSSGHNPTEVPGGLIHDWVGAIFIPGVSLDDTLALLQNYGGHKSVYADVVESKLVSRDGDRFVAFLRFKKKKVITVVLDTTHDAQYFRLDAGRVYSASRTTRIAEVENPDTPRERELPPGSGHGFMWFLNSYWRLAALDGGVYVECQAVSLSRAIPWGFGWLIGPIVNDLPRESLESTLVATRTALLTQPRRSSTTGGK